MAEATTYEGRRQMDRVTARAAADQAEADKKRTAALTNIEIGEAREQARDRERRRREAAKTKALEEKNRRREKRAAARKARNERLAARIGEPLPWVLTVVAASVAVAWPGQYAAVTGLGMVWFLALLVPLFIEGATWSMAWMTKWAIENRKPTSLYRAMTWAFAVIAAGLNASHHISQPELAVTMALSSLVGVIVWEVYMHSQHHKAEGRSGEEIKLALQRRVKHRKVARQAAWLRTATVPPLQESEAWERAWRQVHGAEPGVTHGLLKRHGKQAAKVDQFAEQVDPLRATASLALFDAPPQPVREVPFSDRWAIDPEAISRVLADPANGARGHRARPSTEKIDKGSEEPREKAAQGPHAARTRAKSVQVAPNTPPPARGREKATEEGVGKQVRAAREAARETARAATPEQVEADRQRARAWAVAQLRAGREDLRWKDLREHFESAEMPEDERLRYGETWYRTQLGAAREEVRPLHVVREDEPGDAGVA